MSAVALGREQLGDLVVELSRIEREERRLSRYNVLVAAHRLGVTRGDGALRELEEGEWLRPMEGTITERYELTEKARALVARRGNPAP